MVSVYSGIDAKRICTDGWFYGENTTESRRDSGPTNPSWQHRHSES